jgi:hypothetical protein
MKRLVALTVVITLFTVGCYNTYMIPRSELATLQDRPENGVATVKDVDGKDIEVKDDTNLFVRSSGGKRYPITPFNFKATESQLVASDRDYILDTNGLKENAEVDQPSTWKTALCIIAGVIVAGGLIGTIAWAAATGNSASEKR